jgi:hypothetical protein
MSNCRVISREKSVGTMSALFSSAAGAGLQNGELLRVAADAGFDVLVTADRNLQFQQNLSRSRIGIILLIAPSNALEDLIPLVPSLLTAIPKSRSGELVRVEV